MCLAVRGRWARSGRIRHIERDQSGQGTRNVSNRTQDPRAAGQATDSMLVVIPIFAMLLCVFPVGPIGPPIGFIPIPGS